MAAPPPRTGAGRSDSVPRMENVRVTAPDLARRSALEKTRSRLVVAAAGFCVMFTAVLGKLTLATVVDAAAAASCRRPVAADRRGKRAAQPDRGDACPASAP